MTEFARLYEPVTGPGPRGTGTLPVVWLHAAGLSAEAWCGRAEGICPDLPGHGTAPRAVLPEVAAFADALLPTLPQRFCLVGHSLGGMVAMVLAARFPERVAALVLAEAEYNPTATLRLRAASMAAVWLARHMGPRRLAWFAGIGRQNATRVALRRQMAAVRPEGLVDAFEAARRFDGTPLLARLSMPTLILVGRRNPVTHPQARQMARRLPRARLMVLEAGHMLHSDVPDMFFGTIRAFFGPYR